MEVMHIIEFLNAAGEAHLGNADSVRVEYRLVCSGTLKPDNCTGNWLKSDGARILLQQPAPAELLVANCPPNSYPQELVLRFVAHLVTEKAGNSSHSYYPDREIASDFAALLTLLCRRLITVSAKVRAQYPESKVPPILADYPIPIVTTAKVSCWTPRPTDLIYGLHGVQVRDYDSHDQPFKSDEITETLLALPQLKEVAPAVIRAARLYALAMELIESQSDICYQLFISAVETMAGAVLDPSPGVKGWEPDDQEKIASQGGLVSHATKKEGLSKDVVDRLALAACKGNHWRKRKFKKFLLDYLDREAIKGEDDLFIVPEFCCPAEADIKQVLDDVYDRRSGATHAGKSYPASAAIGPSPFPPAKVFDAVFDPQRPFPPIGWFERIVNSAICGFLRSRRPTTAG